MRTTSPRAAARTLPARLALSLTIAGACLVAAAAPAHAAGCLATYDAVEHRVTIGGCTADPDAPVLATISRTPGGTIQLNGQSVAGATVTNTDQIVYDGVDGEHDDIKVDMSNGPLAPGFTPELVIDEIEISVDGGTGPINYLTVLGNAVGPDLIAVGPGGVDFTDDGDTDISRSNVTARLLVDGQGGNDHLSGIGSGGSGRSPAPLELRGGAGNDVLTGGLGNDELVGGADFDNVVDLRAGGFTLTDAALTGYGTDTLEEIEGASLAGDYGADTIDASGFNGNATLNGREGDDTLRGGTGNDTMRGRAGDDTIEGGGGHDGVMEFSVDGDVTATDGALSGAAIGTDTLASIEAVGLSGIATDQRFDASGFSGRASLAGGGGDDTIIGSAGADFLFGDDGADDLTGGPGADSVTGGTGDDRTFTADDAADQVDCGAGTDESKADDLDSMLDCEQVDRGGQQPPPDPAGDPQQPADPGSPADPGAPADPGTPADPGSTSEPLPPVGATPDTLAPSLSRLRLARAGFRAAPRGAALASGSVGTALRFTLSEPARVTFRVSRTTRGGRYVRLRGKLAYSGVAGANRVVLRGRLRGRALAPGRYRLVARATDAAGNRSTVRRAAFRVFAR